jgi:hypothetical protein
MNLSVVLGFFRYKNSTQLIGKDQKELFKCKIILVSIIKNMKKSNWWDFRLTGISIAFVGLNIFRKRTIK